MEKQSHLPKIQYTELDLERQFDSLFDVCLLEEDLQNACYLPRDRSWVKRKVFSSLNVAFRLCNQKECLLKCFINPMTLKVFAAAD